jgi:hypothetical protein
MVQYIYINNTSATAGIKRYDYLRRIQHAKILTRLDVNVHRTSAV